MVGGEDAVVLGESEGRVDVAAVAGGDADGLLGRGVVGAVGDFDGDGDAGCEGEGRYLVVLYAGGIVRR